MVTPRAIAADAYTDCPGRAALALCLPHGVKQTFLDTFKITVGAAQMLKLARQGILNVLVFTTSALKDQAHFHFGLFPLFKMEDGRAGTQIIAAVLTGNR